MFGRGRDGHGGFLRPGMLVGRAEVADRLGHVFSTRSALIAMAAVEPSPAAVMTCARGLATFPATQMPGTLVRPVASATTQPPSSIAQPRLVRASLLGTIRGRTKKQPFVRAPVGGRRGQGVVLDQQPVDRPSTSRSRGRPAPRGLPRPGRRRVRGAPRRGPLQDQVRARDRLRSPPMTRAAALGLVAMAVGAVGEVDDLSARARPQCQGAGSRNRWPTSTRALADPRRDRRAARRKRGASSLLSRSSETRPATMSASHRLYSSWAQPEQSAPGRESSSRERPLCMRRWAGASARVR